jgi:1,4-dihydroxy-2-naphthoate octaprenyltransferase
MATLRDWLQLFRSHTSPLEMTITITASSLAVGTVLDIKVLLFLIFGWLYHNAGYGHNSVEDFISGFDRDDPNKSHHPLQRGVIDPRTARTACIFLIGMAFAFGIFISEFDPLAIGLLTALTIMGFVYNLFNKRMKGKFLPIALAHSLLFPFAYFGSGGDLTLSSDLPFIEGATLQVAALLWAYLLFQIFYQIMIEGDLKDIDMEEASLLKSMGVYVKEDRLICSPLARTVSFSLKAASISLIFISVWILEGTLDNFAVAGIFGVIILGLDHSLMKIGKWDHSQILKRIAFMEVISTFALAVAIAPEIGGWLPAFGIMAVNIVYFILMNRFLWGTLIKPRV